MGGSLIYIITPNALWLRQQQYNDYKPDKSEIKHFTSEELAKICIDCGFRIKFHGQLGIEQNGQHERLFLIAEN